MYTRSITSNCIKTANPNPEAQFRLFCFPYAGGRISVFSGWQEYLPASVEVCTVQMPRQGYNLQSTVPMQADACLSILTDALIPHLDKPFAFFGHSLGAIVSFELARNIRRNYGIEPMHLFMSGAHAPHMTKQREVASDAPKEDFLRMLRNLNGTPKEILENPELINAVLPLIRAEFVFLEKYRYEPEQPLATPITAFGGVDDPQVDRQSLEAWVTQTIAKFSLFLLPGDHFFINSARSQLLQIISRELRNHLKALKAGARTQNTGDFHGFAQPTAKLPGSPAGS
ncbi:MAG TPA: thioesterase domain-containing protein [Blastocatellia bacterium]|nr:thioesterase domain-containing protein [Blastocatellia bacterium]